MKTFEKGSLIVGLGEIGQSLYNILAEAGYYISTKDREAAVGGDVIENFDVMHICFPYSDEFISEVKKLQEEFKPQNTVIHSTVPVGTSRQLNAVHSPVIGIHPNLEKGIKTFTKFLGGENASEVADYFRRANIKVYLTDRQETTELLKVLCTTKYGIDIEYVKDVKRQCEKYGVPFEAWTIWNQNYNEGYVKLGEPQFVRPNLVPIMKKTGGHCVLPNAKLIDTKFTELIRLLNSEN